ncbi:MAG: hypothetical protein JO257_12470 [Deltaproteobacteria bacterium]|nr:hypothetical protein [Deltaproteobacteria bacterium]
MNTPKLVTPTLSPQLVWLFAAITLAATIGSNYVIPHVIHHPITPKALGGIYCAIFAIGAAAATALTTARGRYVFLAFAVGSAGLAAFFYIVLAKAFGSGLGGALGTFFGAFFALGTLFASIAGTILGRKLRGEQVSWSVSMG